MSECKSDPRDEASLPNWSKVISNRGSSLRSNDTCTALVFGGGSMQPVLNTVLRDGQRSKVSAFLSSRSPEIPCNVLYGDVMFMDT